jgi:DNA-binding response OmpR family regulator
MLIVDDERDICDLLAEFFEAKGFAVTRAFSGEEALEKLSGGEVDVLLLDILLPGLSGIEVLRYARELHPGARVIMVSALDQPDLRTQAQRYGAVAYITKPFSFTDPAWSAALR